MSKARAANTEERRFWSQIIDLGCIVGPSLHCNGRLTIHHCGTGAGGRKNHKHVICLCWSHHQGAEGIDGQRMSKRQWQEKYGSEVSLIVKTQDKLDALKKSTN